MNAKKMKHLQGSADQFGKALELASQPGDQRIELAICLARLYKKDPSALQLFIAESDVSRRVAYYLLEVGKVLSGLRISKARLNRIGWTKLQVIGKYLTADNASELLDLAEHTSTYELKRLMRGKAPRTDTKCVLLYFTPRQYRDFQTAVLRHGGEQSRRGLVGMEKAIMKMVRKSK